MKLFFQNSVVIKGKFIRYKVMIRILSLLLLFVVSISLSGCFGVYICTEGSGHLSRQVYEVSSFNKISINVPSNIFIVQDSTPKLEIETDDNLFYFLYVKTSNDKLIIESEKGLCPRKLDIYITSPDFAEIEVNGNSDIIAQSPLNTEKLAILINGSGDIIIDSIKTKKVSVEVNGSGDVRVGGITESFNVEINGSGDVQGVKLVAKEVQVEINGSGDVYVNCQESMKVGIFGSGDVYYLGNPSHSNIEISGSGTAKRYSEKSKVR
ncbi:MAG: DUF2807 domain-containing protein [Ignavibacteria bacterium]|nr:DUF2807 domain-containing protein [Ignavibacteria bacterium]